MTRRTESSVNCRPNEQRTPRLPFTRMLTCSTPATRVKQFRRNHESMLPPCTNPRPTSRSPQQDTREEFDKICSTGRYKFTTQQNERHKGHGQWAVHGSHALLMQMKTNYNNLLSKIHLVSRDTQSLQKVLQQRSYDVRHGGNRIEAMRNLEVSYQARLDQLSEKQLQAQNMNKIWSHIRQRMAEDKVVYLKRKIELEERVAAISKKKVRESETEIEVENKRNECKQTFKRTRRSVEEAMQFRAEKVDQLGGLVVKKGSGFQQMQCSQLPNSQPQHLNLLMAQLFLNKLLKDKCNRLKQNFQEMERSFDQMKKGVVFEDSNLVGKFLTQNQSFQSMVNIIGVFEHKLAAVKDHNRRLQQAFHETEEQEVSLQELGNREERPRNGGNEHMGASDAAFRIQAIANWVQVNLEKLQNDRHHHSAFPWEPASKPTQRTCSTAENLKPIYSKGDQQLPSKIISAFNELCQKTSKILKEKGEIHPQRRPFRTEGITIKKHFYRMAAEEERALQVQKQNLLQQNRVEREWLKQTRVLAKTMGLRANRTTGGTTNRV